MKIFDIDELKRGIDNLYDLTQITFRYLNNNSVLYSTYVVQQGEEMRMDLVCQSIYNNTNYIDILCSVNNIDNPLNIKEGQSILYPLNNIDSLRVNNSDNTSDIKVLANSTKSTRKDTNRQKYVENKESLPPTVLSERINPVNIEGSRFVIGDGLFNK